MADRSLCTRRRLLGGLGAVGTAGVIGHVAPGGSPAPDRAGEAASTSERAAGGPDRPTPAVVTDRDAGTTYPLVTYNDRTGEYDVTMPVNVRFDLTGSAYDPSDVLDAVGIGDGWTQVVAAVGEHWPTKDAKPPEVWSGGTSGLVPPVRNYRKPIDPLGPRLCHHLYLWPVRSGGELVGVAGQAHVDVGTVADHVGGGFDEAAGAVASVYSAAGWRVVDADFDYGVSPGRLDFWGPTGDRWLRPP
ncbi:hypothetical protein [Halorarum salinum]|uniref:Uncharacterized protein n=1 Tax=Halorarum salinum TaxID=2743089 RepID=A0A7D5LAS5_9EURY|nr:hypothetical protein [Halobaculum salinum]QLG62386.1 hypothetical protein HUG12_11850 [Halobaculum salinum]